MTKYTGRNQKPGTVPHHNREFPNLVTFESPGTPAGVMMPILPTSLLRFPKARKGYGRQDP